MIFKTPPWLIILAALPLHLALALGTDLSPDEAYYLAAARFPSVVPPLVDHPPLVPWLLRLTDPFTSLPVELRVRVWPLLFCLALSFAALALARRRGVLPPGQTLVAWLSTFTLLPTAGGFVATPDGPALVAIVLALLWAEPAPDVASTTKARRIVVALGVGLVAALGALGKVVVLPLLAAVAVVATGRTLVERVCLLAPLPFVAPLLAPSLRFQLHHAYTQTAPNWSLLGALGAVLAALSAQALLWTPWVLVAGVKRLRGAPRVDQALVFVLSALLVASALARALPPEPNWFAPAALVLVVCASRSAQDLAPRQQLAMLLVIVVPTALGAAHTLRPFLPLPERADPTARLHGWSAGSPPTNAPGVGTYGPAAERCVYKDTCEEINKYLRTLTEQ